MDHMDYDLTVWDFSESGISPFFHSLPHSDQACSSAATAAEMNMHASVGDKTCLNNHSISRREEEGL